MAFLRLLRFPNLLIVVLTQYLLYYQLLRPALLSEGILPVFDHRHFALFVFATVLITAVGNIFNDIFDYDIDLLNRPERVVLQRKISFTSAYRLAAFFGITGFLLAVYLAFHVERPYLLFLFPFAVLGLHLYNANLKKRPLTGNLVIALYCAGAGAVLWLAEWPALEILARKAADTQLKAWSVFLWFLVFAFLATAYRELIKDLEDVKGDKALNCRTLPVIWGEQRSKRLALFFGFLLLIFLGAYGYLHHKQFGFPALTYMSICIGAPLLFSIGALHRAKSEKAYHQISQIAKFIILTGILLLLFIRL